MDYSISAAGRQVGRVQVLKEGLYYRIVCHAELSGSVMYRLTVLTSDRRENIGILSPSAGGYRLDKRIPCSRFPSEDLEFQLIPAHEKADARFIPVYPEEPFQYLDRLKDAYLARHRQQPGILIPEET